MPEVTMSSKNQIVVPREAREALRLKPGARLQVMVHGDRLLLMRVPRNPARALAGSMQGTYPPGYLAREREGW
jgi:AbrB family looped-hinge helix DNA binding protein